MHKNPFAPQFNDLPEHLAIFPLPGVLLMPHGQLPLNIFEPRYITMIDDALAGNRMIGMIQPKKGDEIYKTGCAGKITDFNETSDGRYLITLTGICRFHVTQEQETQTPYRQVRPNWKAFEKDLIVKECLGVDRKELRSMLEAYFDDQGMSCDFEKFDTIEDGKLMTCLSMICPFEAAEKQALLETICCVERAEMFMTMLDMAIKSGKRLDKSKTQCH